MKSIHSPARLIALILKSIFHIVFLLQAGVLIFWVFLRNFLKKLLGTSESNQIFWKEADKEIFHCRYKSIQSRGFQVEQYWFETQDKAHVLCWRVHPKNQQINNQNENIKYPIIIQHGLLDCSASWFVHQQQQKCLPFILAKQGYDVWVGNNRGNKYSKKQQHRKQYWDYKFDHLAEHDLPAIISNVLKQTGAQKVIYVGHSQGGTQFMASIGYYPQIIDKIHCFFALGTPISIKNAKDHRLIKITSFFNICKIAKWLGFNSLLQLPQWMNRIVGFFIYHTSFYKWIFKTVVKSFCGNTKQTNINIDTFGAALSYESAGSSIGNIEQWIQSYQKCRNLSKYDYGSKKNIELYGTEEPPQLIFDHLKTVPFHSYLFFGTRDLVLNQIDKKYMLSKFDQKKVSVYDLHDYAHLDYIWGKNAHSDIYYPIVSILNSKNIDKKYINLQYLETKQISVVV